MIGKTVSHYRILSQLGSGGMGVVYGGQDTRLGRAVALKFVPEEVAKDGPAVDRLNSEARTASGLNHPNICTVYDVGEHEGRPFIVMEQLNGQTLRDRLANGSLKIHETIDIGIQVADALDAAHQHGIIHRDIKPANIFLVDRGPVKVLDFGLAKWFRDGAASATTAGPTIDRTAEGITVGTVSYMSPEQVSGDALDARTDLFSLGVVLYECLTGRQPFTGKTSAVICSAILTRPVVAPVVFNPDVPPRLQEIINNSLEKDREVRYQNAASLRADLKRVKRDLESGQSAIVAVPAHSTMDSSSVQHAPTAAPTARAWPTVLGSIVAALIVAGGATAIWMSTRRPPTVKASSGETDPFVRTQLGLAAASLESKDFRGALAYAEQALRAAPADRDAERIRDEARVNLARFNDAIARAGERLAADDTAAAAVALADARAIAPGAPEVGDLAARLSNSTRNAQGARREVAPPSPLPRHANPPTPPAPAPAAPQARASDTLGPPPAPAPAAAPTPPPAQAPATASPAPVAVPPPVEAPPLPRVAAPVPEPPARPVESDDAAIRRVLATYAHAIESKDLALFQTVKPNLSADERRRIENGFRAVTSQRVALTIASIDVRGAQAIVRARRQDTIQAAGREQTVESAQTLTLARGDAGWVIQDIR